MIGNPSDHLRVLSLLRELDADDIVNIMASSLDRPTFERLPGLEEDGPVLGVWLKRLTVGPISVELYTNEPPCQVIAYPVRSKADLRLIS